MQILLTPIVLPLVVCTNLAFSICLYQLTDTSSSLSKVRKCKFLFEMITLTLQYFFLNNSSEVSRLNNSSEVSRLNNSSEVSRLNNSSEVSRLNNSSEMSRLNNSSEVSRLNNSLEVSRLNNSLEVSRLNNSSEVSRLNNSSEVSRLNNSLEVSRLHNSSEIMDDCNAMVCRSINSSHWQHCTLDTKRGLMSLLRICQRPNHLEFYGGVIIPSRDFFLKVIKIAYSFVNFIRCT
ncbi:hypothetical protein M8J77_004516 [Diaphorina citri]|nr:hypothetical protein M8J77_004516 [Diaphorina citri]